MSVIRAAFKNIHRDVVLRNRINNDIIDEGSPVGESSIIETSSTIPQYDTVAYEIHSVFLGRDSVKLFSVRLDLPSGFGRRRTDLIVADDTSVAIKTTYDRGLWSDTLALRMQMRSEKRRGSLFKFGDKHYIGIIGTLGIMEDPDIAGFDIQGAREIICNRAQFGNEVPVESQDEIEIRGKMYLVGKVTERAYSVSFQVNQVED